ncbi:hypothetical protein EXIGLDRAFT_732571 [Exidia glandulosa HHB12029]|uniref:Uncharacterized protein n=1 Tax=Exidia glandulosa HHB12029 TaxID=1314781 RepID=A0A165BH90_EXIGL|nr:hypothetical protein EXIGLDRAFT_732571 [Exidia glandulosa HHB12029]
MIMNDPEVFDDPNRPPSRPASALGDSSDSSDLGNLSDDDDANWSGDELGPPDEWISKRVARSIMRRDGFCCPVRGTAQRKNLLVLRLTAQHTGSFITPQMTWLQSHKLLPAVYEGRNAAENMMTLCHAHAHAYECSVWQFTPDDNWRRGQSELTSPIELIVFRPPEMPPYNADGSSRTYVAVSASSERILRPEGHTLAISPALAYVAATELVFSAYHPAPDLALHKWEHDMVTFRNEKNGCADLYAKVFSQLPFVRSADETGNSTN